MVASRAPLSAVLMTLFEPMPATQAPLPSAGHTMARGSDTHASCSACVTLALYGWDGGFESSCWFMSNTGGPRLGPRFEGSMLAMRQRADWLRAFTSNRCSFGP